MTLIKALEGENINEKRWTVEYPPDHASIAFETETTGCTVRDTKQIMLTEYRLKWYPFMYDGVAYIVSSITDTKLSLNGSLGKQNQNKILQEYAGLYNNESLGTQAMPLTEEIFFAMPKYLQTMGRCYWIESRRSNMYCWINTESVDILERESLQEYVIKKVYEDMGQKYTFRLNMEHSSPIHYSDDTMTKIVMPMRVCIKLPNSVDAVKEVKEHIIKIN